MLADSIFPHHRLRPTTRIGQTIDKLMGGHLLDRQIDGVDFLPFLTVLIAAGLLGAGLFGDGNLSNWNLFGNFGGLNHGNLILQRSASRAKRYIHGSTYPYER